MKPEDLRHHQMHATPGHRIATELAKRAAQVLKHRDKKKGCGRRQTR